MEIKAIFTQGFTMVRYVDHDSIIKSFLLLEPFNSCIKNTDPYTEYCYRKHSPPVLNGNPVIEYFDKRISNIPYAMGNADNIQAHDYPANVEQ